MTDHVNYYLESVSKPNVIQCISHFVYILFESQIIKLNIEWFHKLNQQQARNLRDMLLIKPNLSSGIPYWTTGRTQVQFSTMWYV